ncbi:MAG: uroporphyrinogen decarboxylase family protein [Spirochaetales bacterium]|uniref:Uroporphyrinogen decarboxylase family protein n=1 Tax=Candidatus Thalassospirochaeta sargassi TaxID=3119039 RepID=A0AAJ1ICH7_9SPIO|nr:uroporphyrinogen decarboxylase family protein [Spirochaetales bacterium]
MEKIFAPDYNRIVNAALNRKGEIPLYEHNIHDDVISSITGRDTEALLKEGDQSSLEEYFKIRADFHIAHGYDCYSFEGCITDLVQQGAGLMGHGVSLIKTEADFNSWPWNEQPNRYFEKFGPMFNAIRKTLPPGMKIIGGVGNGMFETMQDFVPFTELCYLEIDNPDLFSQLWKKIEESFLLIWKQFLENWSDILAIGRFGDDLGFKASTLIKPDTIREHVIPAYKNIVSLVHSHDMPFLLHSCGSIFDVMEDIITITGIDAKHSNEDEIAPMTEWLERYGSRIGNFGGVDMNVLCLEDEAGIKSYVTERYHEMLEYPGTAIGSGNQIADYVPPENFQTMVKTVRELRRF